VVKRQEEDDGEGTGKAHNITPAEGATRGNTGSGPRDVPQHVVCVCVCVYVCVICVCVCVCECMWLLRVYGCAFVVGYACMTVCTMCSVRCERCVS